MRRLALLVLLAAACSGDDGGGGPIAIDDLEGALVNTYCNLYVRCGLVDDIATCHTLDLDVEADPDLIAAVKAGKVIYHADQASACLAALGAGCDRATFSENDSPLACDETFEGTVAAGGQCAINEECISRNCDTSACTEACCQGTCVGDTPPVRPRVGEACTTAATLRCVDSYCDTGTGLCTAYKANGEACEGGSQCVSGFCNGTAICAELPATGQPCDLTTGESVCAEIGDTCSATSMTCVPLGLGGDPCTEARDCSPIYQCGASGTCELRPTLGDECGTQAFPSSCIDHSYCDQTTMQCTAPRPDGSTCQSDSECQSDSCDFATSTCTTPAICI